MPFVIDIDPVAFSLMGVPVRWYGLILIGAVAVAVWMGGLSFYGGLIGALLASDRRLTAIEPTAVAVIPHHGIRARFGERRVLVGSRALLEAAGVKAAALANDAVRLVDEGKSPVFVALDGRAAGIIAIGACVGCLRRFQANPDRMAMRLMRMVTFERSTPLERLV